MDSKWRLCDVYTRRSGLEQDDMRIMFKYLTTSLFPAYQEQELQANGPSTSISRNSSGSNLGNTHYGK